MSIYGYARMATREGSLNKQLTQLQKYVSESNIFSDIASGSNFDRPNYQRLRKILKEGDILYITSIEKLCRNMLAVTEELNYFKEKKIELKVIDILFDMNLDIAKQEILRNLDNDLMMKFLTIFAEENRLFMERKQALGIEMYKRRHGGKGAGRPRVIAIPNTFNSVYEDYASGVITAAKAMELLGLKSSTFYRLVKEHRQALCKVVNSNLL